MPGWLAIRAGQGGDAPRNVSRTMGRGRTEQTVRSGAGTLALMALALALALGGCGSTDLLKSSPLDLFSSSSKATNDAAAAGGTANILAGDVDCPEVQVRTGAA